MLQHTLIWGISILGAAGAFYLVFTQKYNDGIVGRVILAAICISSAAGIFKLLEGGFPTRSVTVVAIGLIALAARHVYLNYYHAAFMKYLHGDHHV